MSIGRGNLSISKETSKSHFDPDTSDFSDAVQKDDFVDKTLFIKTILNMSCKEILITAPRRFGKSTNMDMLKRFLEIQVNELGVVIEKESSSNYKIFKDNNLLIFQDQAFFKQYFANYPVIHISFKIISGNNLHTILNLFRTILHITFKKHGYLTISEKLAPAIKKKFLLYCNNINFKCLSYMDIAIGLKFLLTCLHRHYDKEVVVLIDDCDAPIINMMFGYQTEEIKHVNELLAMIFSIILRESQFIKQALLTGIFYFDRSIFCNVNTVRKYNFFDKHPFVKFYGFTETEVDALLNKFNIDIDKKEQVKSYYNWCVSLSNIKLFPLCSILHYLKNKEVKNYWQQSGFVLKLTRALETPAIKYAIEKMLLDRDINVKIVKEINVHEIIELQKCFQQKGPETDQLEPDLYLSFLLQQGYLTIRETLDLGEFNQIDAIKIPNFEIKHEFQNIIMEYYKPLVNSRLQACAIVLNKISTTSTDEIYRELITTFREVISAFEVEQIHYHESVFYSFLFSVICKSNFNIGTNLYDVMKSSRSISSGLILEKDGIGIVFAIRYRSNSQYSLIQITDKRYFRDLNEPRFSAIRDKIYVGLNVFRNLSVTVGWLVNNTDISKAKYVLIL